MKDNNILNYINYLIANDALVKFYQLPIWRATRRYVMKKLDHNECYDCNKKGILTKAVMVHHVNEVKVRPDLALSIYYTNTEGVKERNLVSLCFNCHEIRHNRCFNRKESTKKYVNDEWW